MPSYNKRISINHLIDVYALQGRRWVEEKENRLDPEI